MTEYIRIIDQPSKVPSGGRIHTKSVLDPRTRKQFNAQPEKRLETAPSCFEGIIGYTTEVVEAAIAPVLDEDDIEIKPGRSAIVLDTPELIGRLVRDILFTPQEDSDWVLMEVAVAAAKPAVDREVIRLKCDRLLAESAWTQLLDAPLDDVKRAEWATWRQKIRALPTTTVDPENPVWPKEPQ